VARIERNVDVDASREAVFEVLTDLDLLSAWSTITVSTDDAPSQPISEGDTFRQTLRVLGRNLKTTWTVTELRRPEKVAYTAQTQDGGTLRMAQTVSDDDGRSRVAVELDYELPGGVVGELFDSVYAERRNERELEHSLDNLKDLIEGRRSR
jgi:uncharacterized protein YndB with AHSA1/START domain